MKIRLAAAGDDKELCSLYYQMHPVEEAANIKSKKLIKLRNGRLKTYVLISEKNGKITGFVLGDLITYADFTYGSIEELYVLPAFRRKGVASLLMKRMVKKLKGSGARTVIVLTNDKNKPAIKLYEHLGFRRSIYAYRMI
ncbi:GNAT family N-acetyltransferase [Candidatus Parvarchaeota archaeon]|jgi:Predicted acetyltransferase|nr:GNAT family N-acetyltransferase [Candidatus Parvarchaeota archaeon]